MARFVTRQSFYSRHRASDYAIEEVCKDLAHRSSDFLEKSSADHNLLLHICYFPYFKQPPVLSLVFGNLECYRTIPTEKLKAHSPYECEKILRMVDIMLDGK